MTKQEIINRLNIIAEEANSYDNGYHYEVIVRDWNNYGKSRTYFSIVETRDNSKHYVKKDYGYYDNNADEYVTGKANIDYDFSGNHKVEDILAARAAKVAAEAETAIETATDAFVDPTADAEEIEIITTNGTEITVTKTAKTYPADEFGMIHTFVDYFVTINGKKFKADVKFVDDLTTGETADKCRAAGVKRYLSVVVADDGDRRINCIIIPTAESSADKFLSTPDRIIRKVETETTTETPATRTFDVEARWDTPDVIDGSTPPDGESCDPKGECIEAESPEEAVEFFIDWITEPDHLDDHFTAERQESNDVYIYDENGELYGGYTNICWREKLIDENGDEYFTEWVYV